MEKKFGYAGSKVNPCERWCIIMAEMVIGERQSLKSSLVNINRMHWVHTYANAESTKCFMLILLNFAQLLQFIKAQGKLSVFNTRLHN